MRNEASDDCSTDSEGEEAMLRTIDQLLRSVVHKQVTLRKEMC